MGKIKKKASLPADAVFMRNLASAVAKREGKKIEVSIGNVREVLRVLTDIFVDEMKAGQFQYLDSFLRLVEKRSQSI
jgi:hypothetical protein